MQSAKIHLMYEVYKPLGAIAIGIGWASLIFLVTRWRGDKTMSFSRHAAAHHSAYLFMAIMESIFLSLYFIFIATWYSHTFNMPILFLVLNAISVGGLIIAAWVPDVADIRGKIHSIVAYPAYLAMLLVVPFIIFSTEVGSFARSFSAAALVLMLVLGIYLTFVKNSRQRYLYIQGAFIATVHATLLISTYVR